MLTTKATGMASTQRVSISIKKERAAQVEGLVTKGSYANLSAAYSAATEVLLEREAEKEAWWAETVRRCEEAEKYPERLLDAEVLSQALVGRDSASQRQRRLPQVMTLALTWTQEALADLTDIWHLVAHKTGPIAQTV